MGLSGKLASVWRHASGAALRDWQQRAAAAGGLTAVVCYHRVLRNTGRRGAGESVAEGIPAETFEAQMRFMLRHFEPVAASAAVLAPAARGLRFAVTFDDGYADNIEVAAPILRRLGIPATFYVVSSYVGSDKPFWWDRLSALIADARATTLECAAFLSAPAAATLPLILPLGQPGERRASGMRIEAVLRAGPPTEVEPSLQRLAALLGASGQVQVRQVRHVRQMRPASQRLMSWDELRSLVAQGFEIGGHSADHLNLAQLGPDELAHQLRASKLRIEAETGRPVRSLAYPYGGRANYSPAVMQAVREAGYECAFTALPGLVTPHTPAAELPRVALNWPWPFACAHNLDLAARAAA